MVTQKDATLTARDGVRFPARLHRDDAGASKTAFVMMHPTSDWRNQFMLGLLAQRGFSTLGCANRYTTAEAELILEDTLLDWAACVDYLHAEGFERVVGIGYSGGGEIAAGYQSEAIKSDLSNMKFAAMDGLVLLNAHAGRPFSLTAALDPSVGGESGNDPLAYDPSLDMFNPANGPPYSPEFRQRYRGAQVERNHKITRWCQDSLQQIEAAGDPLMTDIPVIIHRTDANLDFLDPPATASKSRESTRWGIDAKVANYTPGPLRGPSMRLLVLTCRSWLSQRSLAASRFDLFKFLPQCRVPTLVIWGTADAAGSGHAEKAFATAPDAGKKFVRIDGATHFMTGQTDKQAEIADEIAKWVYDRGLG
jgi:pimeloyl-ACP methyl ester carboxylesterase